MIRNLRNNSDVETMVIEKTTLSFFGEDFHKLIVEIIIQEITNIYEGFLGLHIL